MCSALVWILDKNEVYSCVARLFRPYIKYFSFVSICKYLLTAGQQEQAFIVDAIVAEYSEFLVEQRINSEV